MPKFVDKTGERFGNLIVLEHIGFDKHGNARFLCKCDCGIKKEISSVNLHEKSTTISCGCIRFMNACLRILLHKDLSGKKFNKLTVIEEINSSYSNKRRHLYKCLCDCGNICYVSNIALENKEYKNKSCGCLRSEIAKRNVQLMNKKKQSTS